MGEPRSGVQSTGRFVARRSTARPWLVDSGLAVAVLAVAEIAIGTGREADAVARDVWAYVLGVAMAAPVLLRRRYPVTALYLVAAALLTFYIRGYPGFPPSLVLAVPLFDAARVGHGWPAVPVPAAFLLAGVVVTVQDGETVLDAVAVFLPQVAVVVVAVLLGVLLRSRAAYGVEVRRRLELADQEREREAVHRVTAERLRIARELHDTVAHALATITVQSAAAAALLDSDTGRARLALSAVRDTGRTALAEMRATLDVLRTDAGLAAVDDDAGLNRLGDLLTAVRAAGLEVAVDDGLNGRGLPTRTDHAAYRIVQESLTNVLRHAGPSARARVSMRMRSGALTIEVTDDGPGHSGPAGGAVSVGARPDGSTHGNRAEYVPRRGGHGLTGMRERTEALGGRFHAGPGRDGGFMVRAVLPLEAG